MEVDKKYVISIDQGTTSTRALIVNQQLQIEQIDQVQHEQICDHPGWVSHDPDVIYANVKSCIEKSMANLGMTKEQVVGIGIANQRETTVAWDKETGEVLCNAIVWLDKRTEEVTAKMIESHEGDKDVFRPETGLPINTYFSASKMKWMLENCEKVSKAQDEGRLCFGTIDAWIIWKLTGGASFMTDSSNASRTQLMNLASLEWDDKMLDIWGVKKDSLPTISKSSSADFGTVSDIPCVEGVKITGVLGDQQAACLGHCLQPGEVKNTYGTGCFMLYNTGSDIKQSQAGLLSTLCYRLGDETYYALEGAVEIAGAGLEWAGQQMSLYSDFDEFEQLVSEIPFEDDSVYFVPAFSGLFSPYWRDDARGTILGISQHTKKGHILKALVNAVCFRSQEVIDSMASDSGMDLKALVVDGGMTQNDHIMQTQSNISNIPVIRKSESEITALGGAIAAGLESGRLWQSIDEVKNIIKVDNEFNAQEEYEAVRVKRYARWKDAVQRSLGWHQ